MEGPGRKTGTPHSPPATALLSTTTTVVLRIAQTTSRRGRLSAPRAAEHRSPNTINRWSDVWEVRMKRHLAIDSTPNPDACIPSEPPPAPLGELPNRLLTAFDVAKFVGCHEETVR